jgi:hypothetical protein
MRRHRNASSGQTGSEFSRGISVGWGARLLRADSRGDEPVSAPPNYAVQRQLLSTAFRRWWETKRCSFASEKRIAVGATQSVVAVTVSD